MNTLELAYRDLVKDDLKKAKKRFDSLASRDVRAKWGLFLVNLIEGSVVRYPTYFEIRNFLELDIQMLIDNGKGDYVQKIARYADFLFSINPETYKFFARVFAANDLIAQAKFFLELGHSRFYNDPELHYLIADINLAEGKCDAALWAIENCLKILPNYHPAKTLKEKILGEHK